MGEISVILALVPEVPLAGECDPRVAGGIDVDAFAAAAGGDGSAIVLDAYGEVDGAGGGEGGLVGGDGDERA